MKSGRRSSSAVLVATRQGLVKFAAPETRALIAKYLGPFADGRLPRGLATWLAGSSQDGATGPFVADRDGRRLIAHVCLTHDPDEIVLLIGEQTGERCGSLRQHGLTPRESEVLWWVVEGKTNREIGMILGRSARTIQIHLNNVYRKLGVETRTAAAALVLRTSLARDLALEVS